MVESTEDFGLGEAVLAGALLGVLSAVLDDVMQPPRAPVVFIRQSVVIHQQVIWFEAPPPPLSAARRPRPMAAERRRLRRRIRLAQQR